MSTPTSDAPRYATLRDYVRVLRRNRWLILAIAIACAAAAFAVTAREKKNYQAQASIAFQDTSQELNLLGAQITPTVSDATRAQLNAQTLTRPAVVQEVKKELKSQLSPGVLAGPISAAVSTQTNAVVITATAPDPHYAQRLANTFAQAAKTVGQRDARAQFASLVTSVKSQFAPLAAQQTDPVARAQYESRIAEVQLLAKTADPVQIVQSATVPGTPIGPHTARNTILGLLLGLTIGVLIAFIRDALDQRLRGSHEIADQLRSPIVGHVRDSAFGVPAFVRANGKAPAEEANRESFRMLRQNVRFLASESAPRSIVVTSSRPEEGKSTVAAALACACATAGDRTLLVDCDMRRPSLADRLDLEKGPGLSDFLLGEAGPSDVLQVVELPAAIPMNGASANGWSPAEGDAHWSEPRRLVCITAGRPMPESAELLNSSRFKQFLREVKGVYDQVVLDVGPLLSTADAGVVVAEAEATLVCVRSGRTTAAEAAALKHALDRIPHRLVGVVVTGVKPGADPDLGYYSSAYAYESVS